MTYNEQLQKLFHDYEKQLGKPGTLHDAIDWALTNGKIVEPTVDPKTILVRDMRNALRSETRVDDDGREYRANAAVTYTRQGGVQESFWGSVDLKTTPRVFVEEHFAQRRKGVLSDCIRLKDDVDHYNGTHGMQQLPLILDFTDDVAEFQAAREAARKKKDDAA